MSKNVDLSFYFLSTGKKDVIRCHVRTIRRMMHQIDVLSAQKCSCLSRCVRARIVWWRVLRLRRLVFLISWKITGKQMIMYHLELTVLCCSSGTIATCPVFLKKKLSFAWKCFVRKQLLLDFDHLETTIQTTAVYFRAHKRKSTIHQLSQCHRRVSKHRDHIFGAFLSTNRHEPFFEGLTNCVGFNANKYFWQFWMYGGPTNVWFSR